MSETFSPDRTNQLTPALADNNFEPTFTQFWEWLRLNLGAFLPIVEESEDRQTAIYLELLKKQPVIAPGLEQGETGKRLAPVCTKCNKVMLSSVGTCPACGNSQERVG